MSILDIKDENKKSPYLKTIYVYLAVSVLAVAIDNIYSMFGHGVRSAAMTWMFLYPLIGGAVVYLLIWLLAPRVSCFTGYRLFVNIYNSGITVLTVGSLLKGIFEIAGTGSPYLVFYTCAGSLLLSAGLIILLILIVSTKKAKI